MGHTGSCMPWCVWNRKGFSSLSWLLQPLWLISRMCTWVRNSQRRHNDTWCFHIHFPYLFCKWLVVITARLLFLKCSFPGKQPILFKAWSPRYDISFDIAFVYCWQRRLQISAEFCIVVITRYRKSHRSPKLKDSGEADILQRKCSQLSHTPRQQNCCFHNRGRTGSSKRRKSKGVKIENAICPGRAVAKL